MPLEIDLNLRVLGPDGPGGGDQFNALRALLTQLSDKIMSQLSDALAPLRTSVDDVNASIASLSQHVADLRAKVDQGGVTPADMDLIKSLSDDLAAAKAKLDAMDATPTGPVEPTPDQTAPDVPPSDPNA